MNTLGGICAETCLGTVMRQSVGFFCSGRARPRAMTQRWSWIRFALPPWSRGRDGFRLTGELAKPNAALEQIWNTWWSVLPASHTVGTSPSEELFPAHRRRQPLKPDLTPIITWLFNNSACVTTLSSSFASQSPSVRQLNALALHHARGIGARRSADACLSAFPGNHRAC